MLAPSYTLTLGNQQWTKQVVGLDMEVGPAPFVDGLLVRFPFAAPVSASTGDKVSLNLNNGEKSADVFTGVAQGMERTPSEIRVYCVNASAALAQYRPGTTYQSVNAGTVIRNLCGDANVDVGSVDDGQDLAYYVADGTRSAWEHIARVSGWSGSMAHVGADNKVESPVVDASTATVALKYGRELLTIANTEYSRPIDSFTVAGESGAGDASSADAFRLSTDFFQGNAPQGPGLTSRWRSEAALRTTSAAARAGAATQRLYKSAGQRGSFDAFLQPDLTPGTILQIQGLPKGLGDGLLWVYSVRHRLRGAGAVTQVRFYKGGDKFDPSALLGSLLGAL